MREYGHWSSLGWAVYKAHSPFQQPQAEGSYPKSALAYHCTHGACTVHIVGLWQIFIIYLYENRICSQKCLMSLIKSLDFSCFITGPSFHRSIFLHHGHQTSCGQENREYCILRLALALSGSQVSRPWFPLLWNETIRLWPLKPLPALSFRLEGQFPLV